MREPVIVQNYNKLEPESVSLECEPAGIHLSQARHLRARSFMDATRFPAVSSLTTEALDMLSDHGTLPFQNITGRGTSCLSRGLRLSVSTCLQQDF